MANNNKAKNVRKGDLLRWLKEHLLYLADDMGNTWPHNPVYEYGVVMEVSHVDSNAVIVFGFTTKQLFIADLNNDELEIISRAPRKLILPTKQDMKIK